MKTYPGEVSGGKPGVKLDLGHWGTGQQIQPGRLNSANPEWQLMLWVAPVPAINLLLAELR